MFTAGGGSATSAVVAKDGSYSVSLTPGTYTVTVSPQAPIGRGLEPSTVRVHQRVDSKVDFRIDTGIR